jgi:uncharacterized protein (DUF2141 family)
MKPQTLFKTIAGCAGLAASLFAPAPGATQQEAVRLEVRVEGFRSARGQVALALFDDPDEFAARANPVRRAYLTIAAAEAHWIVESVPPGEYALLAYHDENGNGELDFRPLGIPKEPIAVSNGAGRLLGPPRFESAKFAVGGDTTHLTLQLN